MNCRLRTNEREQTMEWDCNRMHAYISGGHPKALYTLMEYCDYRPADEHAQGDRLSTKPYHGGIITVSLFSHSCEIIASWWWHRQKLLCLQR